MLSALLLMSTPSHAKDERVPDADPTVSAEATRDFLMGVNFRGRWLSVPDSVMDIWFFNGSDFDGTHPERPSISAYSIGLEYVITQGTANGIFYVDWMRSLMSEGYWDDVEDPPNQNDGDYVKPSGLGMVALGANYGFGIPLNPGNPDFEAAIMIGGGLGIGFLTGELQKWDAHQDSSGVVYIAYEWYNHPDGTPEPDGTTRIPGVLPLVDINMGMRFTIAQQATIRLEGGLHDMLYLGSSVGVVF